ncbi:histidine kinase [Actinoplanes sp. NPDC051411]|uniref:sensor histidine kinase n=1 Tax=Actinoplanes sp. NPDC051411 TaxID=3155522 RepID=UPI00342E6A36
MRTDAGLIALAAVLGALFCLDAKQVTVVDLAVGVLACAALLARRRWPVLLTGLLIASTALSAAGMGATAIAVGAVTLYRSPRVTAAVVAVHAVGVAGLFALVAADHQDFIQGTAVILALDAAAVATGLLARSLRERAQEADVRHFLQIEEARYAERERIAREMHDVLAHRISLIAVHAGALEVRRSAPEAERQAAAVVRQCAYDALEDLRAVIGMLRDDAPLDADRPQPTLTDLPALVGQARLAGTPITVEGRLDDLPEVPEAIGRHFYRVVQEGLTNARKHAPGSPVRIRLKGGGQVAVEITNPLSAAPAELPGAGSGLIGLGERMDLIDGELEFGPTPNGEFRLSARVPWPP